ncbi:MAG: hypothetical protein ABI230_01475 [Aestuariivirga sp.]
MKNDIQDLVYRRAQFVCQEAKLNPGKPDQSIKCTLYAISNYLSVGQDGNSPTVKRLNRNVSKAALTRLEKLLKIKKLKLAFDKWHKSTTNEHPKPLNQIWKELCEQKSPAPEYLLNELSENKMITITKKENSVNDGNGQRAKGSVKDRTAAYPGVRMPDETFRKIQTKRVSKEY